MDKSLSKNFSKIEKLLGTKNVFAVLGVTLCVNLFFIQAFRAFVPGIYSSMFHVVFGQDIVKNLLSLLSLLLIFFPLLTRFLKQKVGHEMLLTVSLYAIIGFRLIMAFHLPTVFETIFAGIIIAAWGIYLSIFLTRWMENQDGIANHSKSTLFFLTLLGAFLIDYFIRSIGLTQDLSLVIPGISLDYWYITQYLWLIIQIPLTVLVIYLHRKYFEPFFNVSSDGDQVQSEDEDPMQIDIIDKKQTRRVLFLLGGFGFFFFLMFNFFLYPNTISLYTNTNYYFNDVLSIMMLIIAIFGIWRIPFDKLNDLKMLSVTNIFLVLFLILFAFVGNVLTYIASLMIIISLIVIYLNAFVVFRHLTTYISPRESLKRISISITLSFLFCIVFEVLHILATDWAYTVRFFKNFGPYFLVLGGICYSLLTLGVVHQEKKRSKNLNEKTI